MDTPRQGAQDDLQGIADAQIALLVLKADVVRRTRVVGAPRVISQHRRAAVMRVPVAMLMLRPERLVAEPHVDRQEGVTIGSPVVRMLTNPSWRGLVRVVVNTRHDV